MVCSQIYFVSWDLTADAESGFFGKSIDNGNIHSCFCKFAFLKLFVIATDCIQMQIGKSKRSIHKHVENKK